MDTVELAVTHEFIDVDDPLFESGKECGSHVTDFVDGYPADTGYFDYNPENLDRDGLYTELLDGLGVPATSGTGTQLLFKLVSGLRTTTGFRLDCGCTSSCSTDGISMECASQEDLDSVEVSSAMVFTETIGARELRLDGSITSLFVLA